MDANICLVQVCAARRCLTFAPCQALEHRLCRNGGLRARACAEDAHAIATVTARMAASSPRVCGSR
eukprot:6192032-Pleurochrysis_carterae.AAC.2